MRILVTGAGGFAGAKLVSHLLKKNHQIIAIIGSSRGHLLERFDHLENIQVVRADLSKSSNLPGPVDAIFHAAARAPGPGVSPDDMVRDNVLVTRNLIAYAKDIRVKRFVFFSSLSVYGEVQTDVLDEKTPICNPSLYGLTKLLCEEMLKAESASIRSLAIRLPGIVGPRSARNWLSRSLMAAYAGEDIKVFNVDAPFNNAVHIDDLCCFLSGLLNRNWEGFDIVCLGAAGQLRVEEVARFIAKGGAHGSKVIIENSGRTSFQISSVYAKKKYDYSPMHIKMMLEKLMPEARLE